MPTMTMTSDHHHVGRAVAIVQAVHRFDSALDRRSDLVARLDVLMGDPRYARECSEADREYEAAERTLFTHIEANGWRPLVLMGHEYLADRTRGRVIRQDVTNLDGRELV